MAPDVKILQFLSFRVDFRSFSETDFSNDRELTENRSIFDENWRESVHIWRDPVKIHRKPQFSTAPDVQIVEFPSFRLDFRSFSETDCSKNFIHHEIRKSGQCGKDVIVVVVVVVVYIYIYI